MSDLQDEFKTIVTKTNIYDIRLAELIEKQGGYEIGTFENLMNVRLNLEIRIKHTKDALNILDDEKHEFAKMMLQDVLNNVYIPTLKKVNQQIDKGDYRNTMD